MTYRYEDIRNFYFENELGQRIDCQKVNGNLFLFNIMGLGFEKDVEYIQIGNSFIKNKEKIKQGIIEGELEFYDMTYDEYSNFIDFVLKSESLKLIYIPKKSNRIEYYRDIDIVKIEKNDEDDFNILTSPISIYCTSLWYKENNIVYIAEEIENEIRWDFEWDSKFTDYENRNLIFENKGHVEAPFLLEMNGYVLNPKVQVYVNNEKIYELALNITIEENEKLMYSTKDNDLFLYLIHADNSQENLFNYLDLNNINFFELPKGVSEVKVSGDNEIINTKLTIFEEFVAV